MDLAIYNTVEDLVKSLRPSLPVSCIRKHMVTYMAQYFLQNFKGKTIYSVKSNPDDFIVKSLYESGIRDFDVASITEVEQIIRLFPEQTPDKKIKLYYMHPVKSREAIKKSYFDYGVRDYSLDTHDELEKILQETGNAKDLNLLVRISIPGGYSSLDFSHKFGVKPDVAPELIRETRKYAKKLGICFHVGSQCMNPDSYHAALIMIKDIIDQAGVEFEIIDVGGGFPAIYPDLLPPEMSKYFQVIHDSISEYLGDNYEVWCEPGRALVAESMSLITKVELRKSNNLYINDGTYGGLFDAGSLNFIYPTKAIRIGGNISSDLIPFVLYGPTCDSLDVMKGPFYLPEDIREGDYIEIGQLGAYSNSMRTKFNGFYSNIKAMVNDDPLMSLFLSDGYDENGRKVA